MATKYVDPISGSNSNNGNSLATAYQTLAFAGVSPQTSAGDIIVIKNGTYTSISDLYTYPTGRFYQAQTTGSVIIDAANSNTNITANSGSGTTTLYGLTFRNFAPN